MKIEKLNISNFGKFADFAASFGPGVNIIKGANETGKSTLVEAITSVLFTDAKSKKKSLQERIKWGTEGSKVAVSLSSDANKYDLNKDFLSGIQVIEDKNSRKQYETKEGWEKFLEGELGISNPELYNATACVRQDEMNAIAKSPDVLRDNLEGIITGGQEEVVAGRVIDDLNKRINEIKKEGTKNPGILQRFKTEVEDLGYEVEKMTRELEAADARRGELVEVASKFEQVTDEFSEKSELFGKWKKASKAIIEKRELQEKYDDLKKRIDDINQSQQRVMALRNEISGKPEILKEDISSIEELETKIRYLEGKITDSENDEKLLKSSLADLGGLGMFIYLNLFNFILMVGCGAVGFLYEPIIAAGSGFFLLTQVVWIILLWKRSTERAALISQIKFLSRRLDEVRLELSNAQDSANDLMRKYKLGLSADIIQTYTQVEEVKAKIIEETARYESLLGDKKQKNLQDQLDQITRDLAVARESCDQVGDIYVDPEKLEKLDSEVSELSAEKIKFEEKKKLLTEQLELTEISGEQLAAFQERLEHNETMYERYDRRLNIYRITASFIETARANILKATAELLENNVGKYLSDITSGKYDKIRFDRSTLDFSVFSPEKGDWIASGEILSRGTIDQIYLCARLALLNILTGDKKPFIILDDPFVHFDPERTQNAMKVIKQMSSDYQILFFTNSDNYDASADKIIQL